MTAEFISSLCFFAVLASTICRAQSPMPDPIPIFTPGARILFQGDSITDGNRGRNEDPNHILGHGYVFIIAAKYGAAFPDLKLTFINRGTTANTVVDLQKRWKADTLDLNPDILSLLAGANDTYQKLPMDQFEKVYDRLLADMRARHPGVKLVLGEPFALPVGDRAKTWATWGENTRQQQAVVARLAQKYGAALVRYQQVFDEAQKHAPAEYWIWDGVHPTYAGHQLMADEWVRTVQQNKP